MTEPRSRKKRLLARLRAVARELNGTFIPLAIGLATLADKVLDAANKL